MMVEIGRKVLPYCLFFIWPLAIVSKALQLLMLSCLLLFFIIYNRKRILVWKMNVVEMLLLLYCVWYLFSMMLNVPGAQIDRILASLNTVAIWFISVFLCFVYRNTKIDYYVISRIGFYNILIIDLLSIIYFIKPGLNLHIGGRTFIGYDWLDGIETGRFFCFFEYPNLVAAFCLIFFPISLLFVTRHVPVAFAYLYCVISLLPILAAASRSGVMLGVVMVAVGVSVIRTHRTSTKISNGVLVLFISLLMILLVIARGKNVGEKIIDIYASRSGSNNTRFSLYSYSLQKMLDVSPFIGCGIKETIPEFGPAVPLGSHSTYIGALYKTGIIGFLILIMCLIYIVKTMYLNNKNNVPILLFSIIFFCFLIFEDIDGADWLLALVLSVVGCVSNDTSSKEICLET